METIDIILTGSGVVSIYNLIGQIGYSLIEKHKMTKIYFLCFGFAKNSVGNCTKGQLISKGLFWYPQFFQKTNKKINLTTMIPQVELFLFVFQKNSKNQKDILK